MKKTTGQIADDLKTLCDQKGFMFSDHSSLIDAYISFNGYKSGKKAIIYAHGGKKLDAPVLGYLTGYCRLQPCYILRYWKENGEYTFSEFTSNHGEMSPFVRGNIDLCLTVLKSWVEG